MSLMNAVIVGRHVLPPNNVVNEVGRVSENMPVDSQLVKKWLLEEVFPKAIELEAAVVFQAVPAQLLAALMTLQEEELNNNEVDYAQSPPFLGVVVSKAGSRPAGVTQQFILENEADASIFVTAIAMANPQAKVSISENVVSITVDPPMRFDFSHIEWIMGE